MILNSFENDFLTCQIGSLEQNWHKKREKKALYTTKAVRFKSESRQQFCLESVTCLYIIVLSPLGDSSTVVSFRVRTRRLSKRADCSESPPKGEHRDGRMPRLVTSRKSIVIFQSRLVSTLKIRIKLSSLDRQPIRCLELLAYHPFSVVGFR